MTPTLADLHGVPECFLSDRLLATLPGNHAPAPWEVRASGLVWMGRGGAAATAVLPKALRRRGAVSTAVVGGFVRYQRTPVGPYDEVFGVVGYRIGRRIGASVVLMAVDSASSLVGGRSNWAMPKTLARFEGGPGAGSTFSAEGDDGVDWSVTATTGRAPLPLPVLSRARMVQEFPDGSLRGSRLRARGLARPTTVHASAVSTGSLADWLPTGRCRGTVLQDIRFSLGVPQPE